MLSSCFKGNHLAYIGAQNQRYISGCVIATFSCEKGLIFPASRKYIQCGIKVTLKHCRWKGP